MTAGTTYDVVVIGAGVVGCSTAYELSKRGASVLLVDKESVGAGATSAAAGMLAPQAEAHGADDWFRLLVRARDGYGALAEELREASGMDVEYRRDGVLRVALSEGERAELRERGHWQREQGLKAEWLEPDEVAKLEPAVTPANFGGLWLPEEAQVRSPRLVRALGVAACRRGVELREATAAIGLERSGDRVTGVRTAAGVVRAEKVLLASGAWGASLLDGDLQLPLTPVKGQLVSGLAVDGALPRRIVWSKGVAYLTPKVGGELLIGATEEEGSFDVRPSLKDTAKLIAGASSLLTVAGDLRLAGAWCGLRPATPDRLPLLGPVPDSPGLFVASGHYRNGILLGPLTGALMAQLVAGQKVDGDLSPFSPARFARTAALT